MCSRSRSAPASWGDWPPTQARIDEAIARALPAVYRAIARRHPDHAGPIVLVPATPSTIDLQYSAGDGSGPPSTWAPIGHVHVIGKQVYWALNWNPATDTGRAVVHRGHAEEHWLRQTLEIDEGPVSERTAGR